LLGGLAVIVAVPAMSLTEEEIWKAAQKGREASDAKEVPAFIKAGGVKAPSDMVRDAILPLSGAGYDFLVGNCKTWIQNSAYTARSIGAELDVEACIEHCVDRDELRVAVVREGSDNIAWGVMTLSFPTPARPVKAIWLIVDGETVEPRDTDRFDVFGPGNGFVVFDGNVIEGADRIWIVATIEGRSDHLKVELRDRTIRKLSRKP